jgi:hypothetical protein
VIRNLKHGFWILLLSIVTTSVMAQDSAAPKRAAKKRELPPAFQPPEVNEDLPNVLLIGDSISIGYMLAVRDLLADEANVWRPAANCGPTIRGLESLPEWLGDRKWDVIHFNFGLHDLKFMGPNNQNLADPAATDSHPQVSIELYAENLRKIAKRLKKTGATVVWCQTTPVPEGAKGRIVGDAKRYNEVAAKVMQEVGGIEIDPLYEFAIENVENKPANVHYSTEGSKQLAEQVAKSVRAGLAKSSPSGR